MFDALWGIVKVPLNLIIDGINWVIGGLNKISFSLPSWIPGVGGKSFGISIPKIPKLAVGTNYVPQDMLAYLHEGEAVVPKAYNPAAGGMGEMANVIASAVGTAVLQAMQVGGQGDSGRPVIINMDSRGSRGMSCYGQRA